MAPVSIAIVDDHRVVTRSLKAWLESFADFRVVGVAESGEQLLGQFDAWRPDVVLQDLLMPGGIDGIETTRRVKQRAPAVKVIALTASMDEARMMGVLRAGASGYIRKDAEPEALVAAVRAVARGQTYIDPAVRGLARTLDIASDTLTTRELDVLREIARGRSNRDIGAALGVGEETVKTHVSHLLAKLQVENRAQAIAEGMRRGVLSLEDLDPNG